MSKKRFLVQLEEGMGMMGSIKIVVDSETGVNYILTTGGVTPLLDSEGKVVVSNKEDILI